MTLVNRTLNDIETTTMFQLNALLLTSLCPAFIAPAGESPGKYRLSMYSFPCFDLHYSVFDGTPIPSQEV